MDDAQCSQGESGGTSENQSSGQNGTDYTEVKVDATRASNSDPMIVNVWIPEMEDGPDGSMLIKARAEVDGAPSDANPLGSFFLTWQMLDATGTTSMGSGQIATADAGEGQLGYTFYESMSGTFDGFSFLLNYGGQGNFWGIPEDVIDTDGDGDPDRWARKFAIADGVVMGPTGSEYVIKALDIEQTFSEVAQSNCDALALTPPNSALPTAVTGALNDASIPTVTSAPKVIAGEIQAQ